MTGFSAAIGGTVDRVKGTDPPIGVVPGEEVLVSVHDLGEPGVLDGANWGEQTGASTTCPTPAFSIPLSQGNYIVHMDPPLSLLSVLDLQIAEFEAAAGEH